MGTPPVTGSAPGVLQDTGGRRRRQRGGGARQVHAQPQAACGASGIPTRDSPGSVPWEEHPGPRWARISEPNTAHLNTEPQLFPYKMGLIRELQRTKPQMSLQNKEGEGARGRRRRVCGLN